MGGVGTQIVIQIVGKVETEQVGGLGDAQMREAFVGEVVVPPIGGGNGLYLGAGRVGKRQAEMLAAEEVGASKAV